MTSKRDILWLAGLLSLVTAGLVIYSQTHAFTWDEGFHLLAAQSITKGKLPYVDFCFPQTLLNAYWNAALFMAFGQGWRVAHLFAALFASASAALIAQFAYSRFPVEHWRLYAGIGAGLLLGTNELVYGFGTVGQAYGMCLFLSVAAFRVTVRSIEDRGAPWAFCAGLFGGGTAAASLLSGPVVPVLALWMLWYNRAGNRWLKLCAYFAGCAIPFLPVILLFLRAPQQTFFNVFQYQLLFRRVNWGEATSHDIETLSSWIDSGQSLVLGLFALAALWFLIKDRTWPRQIRNEFLLSGYLAVAMVGYLCTPHPTFSRYFVVSIPFVALLAAVGIFTVGSRLSGNERPRLPFALAIGIFLLGLARAIYGEHDSFSWTDFEQIAVKVNDVTPPAAKLYANEVLYFVMKREAPYGMDFFYSHKLELPPDQERLYRIVSQKEFDTLVACEDDHLDDLNLPKLYRKKEEVADCTVYWDKNKPEREVRVRTMHFTEKFQFGRFRPIF